MGPQTPEEGKALGLPFPVLSDPDLEVTKQYGLLHEKGLITRDVPRPTTILVGGDRVVLWIHAAQNVRIRPTVDEVIEQLRK